MVSKQAIYLMKNIHLQHPLKQMKEELTQYMLKNTNTVLNTLNELVKSKSEIS